MKKAIIFGVTGQDGSHLADLLVDKGYHVIGVTRRTSTSNTQRIEHLLKNRRFDLVEGDITDSFSVFGIFRAHGNVEEIYNLAAQSHVATSFKQPALTWDATGKGPLNILQSLIDLEMLNVKYYQASSSEMFGKNYDEREWSLKYQDENTKFLPQSPYAIAKCSAHYMVRLFREAYGIHASSGILFNHEGPRRGENFVTRKITKWIGEFMKWKESISAEESDLLDCNKEDVIKTSDRFPTSFPKLRLGNLDACRDWGYAGDYVEAMWLMLQQEVPDDYVICTGETYQVRDFVREAFKVAGIENWERFITIDPEFYRPAEVDYLRGDCTKAKEKLGWEIKHSFSDLVRMMVESDYKKLNEKKL